MQLELEGKVAVVTGASRGIGLAAARAGNVTGADFTIGGGLIKTL
jgi:NAD(P)-dependent dehydrogenase (short-subunit alcohol dehydrogenase family)